MRTPGSARTVLASTFLVLVMGGGCAPGEVSAPAAFDITATVDQYLSAVPADWGVVTPAALNARIESGRPLIVDVREDKEIAESGHLHGSINVPIRSLAKDLGRLGPRTRSIVVLCAGGHRSALGMVALQLLGWTDVKSLEGGFRAWKAADLPIAPGTPPEANAGVPAEVSEDLRAALDTYLSGLPAGWDTLPPATLKDLLASAKPFQLDVREANEAREGGFIEGSTSIPLRGLIGSLDRLPPDKRALIVAECSTGHRSAMAMMALNLLGYTDVRSLAGGIAAWTKASLPISVAREFQAGSSRRPR